MSEYVYPKDALPEIEYAERPKKSCRACCNGQVTNAGAHIPGYECTLIEYLFKLKKIENGNPQVDEGWGTCKFHNIPLKSIKDMRAILFKGSGLMVRDRKGKKVKT